MSSDPKKLICVVGGGLGGLAFAQGMRSSPNYDVVVFERDESISHRSQGYQIAINDVGWDSLDKLDLPGFHELFSQNCVDGLIMTDHKLTGLAKMGVGKKSLVNRFKLRDILAAGLNIQWNKKFLHYEETEHGVVVHFEDGTSVTAALLVGADGVNSKVRGQYRPDLAFEPTGISSLAGFFPISDDQDHKLTQMREFTKKSMGRAYLSDTHTILFMRFVGHHGEDNHLWVLSYDKHKTEATYGAVPVGPPAAVLEALMHRVQSMDPSPELLLAMELTPSENVLLPTVSVSLNPTTVDAHVRPTILPPTHHRVILIGDAAHAMTTHAGRGANTAFADAYHLSRAVLGRADCDLDAGDWPARHAQCEKHLFATGLEAVQDSYNNTFRIHAQDRSGRIATMRWKGFFDKTWNLVTKGSFKL